MKYDCEYKVLSKDLNEKLFLQRTPLSGGIELTNRCNFKCVHCYETVERDGEGKVFATERLIQIIDELINAGVVSVFLTGGEAMLRPDFNYIYKYLRTHGVLVAILSNGSTVTKDKCELFKKYQPRMIDISLYGTTEETYQRVTKVSGMFNKVMKGLQLLKDYSIPFQLKGIILKENKNEINAMREIAKQFDVPFKFFTGIRPYNDGNQSPMKHMLCQEEIVQMEQDDRFIIEHFRKQRETYVYRELSERQKKQHTYLCRIAKNSFFISYDGILNGCVRERRKGFDLKISEFSEGWEYLYHTFVEPKEKNPFPCSECKIMDYCDFCPGEFEIETGSPIVAPKEICELAHLRFETFGR